MTKVSDILARKGTQVLTVAPTTTVYASIETMVDHNVGSVLVTDGGTICGIFTERDYLRRIVLKGRTSKTTDVGEVMTSKVIAVNPDCYVEECMALMTRERIRHLPVVADDGLAGVVSIGDVVKHLSQEQEVHIRHLTDYIEGKYPA